MKIFIFPLVESKDLPPELVSLKKDCQEKDGLIKSLKNQLDEVEQKYKFENGMLLKEKDALASDLEATQKVCKGLMAHMVELREYWRKHIAENTSFQLGDESVLHSLSDLMNLSTDLLNSSSQVLKDSIDDTVDFSHKHSNPPRSTSIKAPRSSVSFRGNKGMSSLGLLNDFSFFNENVQQNPSLSKYSKSLQTESPEKVSEKVGRTMIYNEVEVQTDDGLKVDLKNRSCQVQPVINLDQIIQTSELNLESHDIQTDLVPMVSVEIQYHVECIETEVQTDLVCIKKKSNLEEKTPRTQDRTQRNAPIAKGAQILQDTFSIEDVPNKENNEPELDDDMEATNKNQTPKPTLKASKRSYTILSSKKPLPTPRTSLIPLSPNIPILKDGLMSARKEAESTLSRIVQFNNESLLKSITKDGPKNTASVRVSLSYNHHYLLRNNLDRLSSLLLDLNKLNKAYIVLHNINQEEFSAQFSHYLKDMRHVVNSSQVISHHFTVVDENSVLVQFEKLKAKKANIERVITTQMKKTDKILRKAKLNLRG